MRGWWLFQFLILLCFNLSAQDEGTRNFSNHQPDSLFNSRNIHNPYQLIQGKIPGMLIARPGSDPNQDFAVRMRGINTSLPLQIIVVMILKCELLTGSIHLIIMNSLVNYRQELIGLASGYLQGHLSWGQ